MTKNKQKSQILVKNNAPARNAHPEPRTWGPQVAPSGPMGPMGPMGAHGGPMGAPWGPPWGSPYFPLFPTWVNRALFCLTFRLTFRNPMGALGALWATWGPHGAPMGPHVDSHGIPLVFPYSPSWMNRALFPLRGLSHAHPRLLSCRGGGKIQVW